MSRVLVLAYGVVAYLAFLAVFAGAVGFVDNIGVVRGIDGGEQRHVSSARLNQGRGTNRPTRARYWA